MSELNPAPALLTRVGKQFAVLSMLDMPNFPAKKSTNYADGPC